MTREPARSEPLFPQPLLDSLAAHPDRTAFEHGSRIVLYSGLLGMVRQLMEGMRAAGLGPGKGVGMLTAHTPEGFAAHVAAHALGCTVAGIRPGWSPSHLASVLASGFGTIVGDPSTLTPELSDTLEALEEPPVILSLGRQPGAVDLFAGAGGGSIEVEARREDIARLNFTSGSTGQPKGCARTYRTFSLLFDPERWAPDLAHMVAGCRRFLTYGSWSIPVRFTFAARSLVTGGTVVIADNSAGPPGGGHGHQDPGDDAPGNQGLHGRGPSKRPPGAPDLPQAIAHHRITGVTMNVPALHRTLMQLREALDVSLQQRSSGSSPPTASDASPLQEAPDVSCLEAVIVSGSPASPALLASAIDLLGPVIWQGYGQAESGMISLLTPEDCTRYPETALTSVGRPLPDVEISARDADDPDGAPAGPGETGEIYVRSPQMMSEYWNDPQGSNEILGEHGWLRTRDLGYLDQTTGLLHLTGRSRDVIMVNAEVCYAGAIEQILARHPHVDQGYVIGTPDEQTGEAIHAFVIPASDRVASDPTGPVHRELREELSELVRSELTANHVPKTVTAIGEVPVAASGKPDKPALAKLLDPNAF